MRRAAREELQRRRRWEREVLRDAMRGRHLRDDPDAPWLPGLEVLDRARALLKAGGCEGERRPLEGLRQDARLSALVEILPARDAVDVACDRAEEQGADALLLGTHHFAFGGSPRQLRPARERFSGPVILGALAADEADIAIAAALEADAVFVDVRFAGPLAPLFAAARCYAMPLLVQADDRATLEAARSAEAERLLLRRPDEPSERAAERSFRLIRGLPDGTIITVAGARSLRSSLSLRRAGADAALLPPALLDQEIEALTPADEPDAFAPDAALLDALGAMGVLDPFAFTASPSGILLPGAAPAAAEPEEPFGCPLDVLRARRPRGLRV